MENLVQQRCFHHAHREAVARCPECLRFFCRECVTEHDDRVICAACLRKASGKNRSSSRPWRGLVLSGALACGVWLTWVTFFLVGKLLLRIPTSFHDGTLWETFLFD